MTGDIGVVAIGRNEGLRLRQCLTSLRHAGVTVVYVDSGSTDDSATTAQSLGAHVVTLDLSCPFTAARARNAGFEALVRLYGDRLRYIQFVDGDCEIEADWLATARAHLEGDSTAAIVCGRRRERYPHATIYNLLCDMEWNTAVGRTAACGGDSFMRRSAFDAVRGFDPSLIAGEEPDLCFRLRAAGWTVWRLNVPMTRHDADMTRFDQFWRRAIRGGWAYAEGAFRHGQSAERYNCRALRSVWLWGVVGPAIIILGSAAAFAYPTLAAVPIMAALAYPAMMLRITVNRHRRFDDPWLHALLYGTFTMIGKLAQAIGVLRFHKQQWRGEAAHLIEYK
jgi:GT2 family glycosyltransferase